MLDKKYLWLIIIIWISCTIQYSFQQDTNSLKYFTPFKETQREKYKTIHKRTVSVYGAHRNSYKRGHKHAGIDLKGKLGEKVYAIAKGSVAAIQLSFPHLTVVVKHTHPNQDPVFSRYTHVEDIKVKVGDQVDQNTCLARIFNAEELKKSKFGINHLHLEIRKSIADNCRASWTSMTMAELNKFCQDPLKFFKKVMK